MSKLVLEGGTDVAEIALFSLDTIPKDFSDGDTVAKMQSENTLIRLQTEGDGGYLLHLYISEKMDRNILQYCNQADKLQGEFIADSGKIGFGGLESSYLNFKSNKHIREDGEIEKGYYTYTAYETDYPDEMIEQAVFKEVGSLGMKKINTPSYLALVNFVFFLVQLFLAFTFHYAFLMSAFLGLIFYKLMVKNYTNTESFKKVNKQKEAVEKQFPNIVIELKIDANI